MASIDLTYAEAVQLIAAGESRIREFTRYAEHGVPETEWVIRDTSSAVRRLRTAFGIETDEAMTEDAALDAGFRAVSEALDMARIRQDAEGMRYSLPDVPLASLDWSESERRFAWGDR